MLVALGMEKAGLFSNDDELAAQIHEASEATGEYVWRMPMGEEYNKMLDSKEADMRNISAGRWGGSITAACFLERFIQKDQKWAHMDVAGVVWADKAKPMVGTGATGFAVRSSTNWFRTTTRADIWAEALLVEQGARLARPRCEPQGAAC